MLLKFPYLIITSFITPFIMNQITASSTEVVTGFDSSLGSFPYSYPTNGSIAGKHIRFSVQLPMEDCKEKLKKISVKMPNGCLIPLDIDQESNGRIPVCDFYPFNTEEKLNITLVGHDDYEGCEEQVIFSVNRQHIDNLPLKEKGKVLTAVRIQIEDRLETRLPNGEIIPSFVRARGIPKYAEIGKETTPLFNLVKMDEFLTLAPSGTYANDTEILKQVIEDLNFTRIEDSSRLSKYINLVEGDSENDSPDNISILVGEYVRRATNKYGLPDTNTVKLLINFFIQKHVIDRTEVLSIKEMLAID